MPCIVEAQKENPLDWSSEKAVREDEVREEIRGSGHAGLAVVLGAGLRATAAWTVMQ